MTETIKMSIPGIPQTKLRPRFSKYRGKVKTYDSQKEEKETVKWQIKSRMQGKKPILGAIEAELNFFMPIPKSLSGKKKALMADGQINHLTKPDIDNLLKFPLDCMNGIVYIDDKQIHKITATKQYDFNPRTEIIIKHKEEKHEECRQNS